MSWDVHLEVDLGGLEPFQIPGLETNYTSNVYEMFFAAAGYRIQRWDTLPAYTVASECVKVIAVLQTRPENFRKLEPSNGWGDLTSFVEFLNEIKYWCVKYPKATFRLFS